MFEVEHLRYATLATVSRCGMIWFSEDIVEPNMVYRNYLETLSTVALDADDDDSPVRRLDSAAEGGSSPYMEIQRTIVSILEPFFREDGLINAAIEHAQSIEHIMDFTTTRALSTLFSLINKT